MKTIIREHFETELGKARSAILMKDFDSAWIALQRSHILAQAHSLSHAQVHWEMLKLAWKQRDLKELVGQVIPMIVAVPLTLLIGRKRALRGGKANIGDLEKQSIPGDLLQILTQEH